jgi:GNAT superfamily N-acetyltransferase
VPGGSALARIEGLFVRPLLTFMGIGSTLLIQAEHRAREAGFDTFVATVPAVSVPFLMRFGYEAVAHGPGLPGSTVRDEPLFLMRKRETLAADLATGLLPDAVVAGE